MLPTLLLTASLLVLGADAHSYMAIPTPRPVTDDYRAKVAPQFKNSPDEAIQRAPLENFSGGQLDMNNGCRGFDFNPMNPVVEITPGQKLDVLWLTHAWHPGRIRLHIVRPKTLGSKTKWEQSEEVPLTDIGAKTTLRAPPTINSYQNIQAVANIPASLSGCHKAGECALQWVLDSSEIGQHYYTCADMVVKGSNGASTAASSPASQSHARAKPMTAAPAPAPASAPRPATASTAAKCVRRLRK